MVSIWYFGERLHSQRQNFNTLRSYRILRLVWAVDPDYVELATEDEHPENQAQYPGYVRVRLRQLVDKIFEVRKYHEEQYPMAELWSVAQNSQGGLFVPFSEKQQRKRSNSDTAGSALGAKSPTQAPKQYRTEGGYRISVPM